MTREEFNELPFVLKPQDMRRIFGFSKKALRVWRTEHPETVFRRRGQAGGRGGCTEYRKDAVAGVLFP